MTKEVKIIKIFIASSDELTEERRALADMVGQLNYSLNKIGLNILLVKWEYLDASMGPLHKQEEYNRELKECEICMVLYWTKFGMYTKAELDTAYSELIAGRNPHKLYVYFKDSEQPLTPELKEFQDSFPSLYGHFYCVFKNEDALKSHFLLQFIDYQNTQQKSSMSGLVEVKDAKVIVAGREYVDLNNVDFLGNNEEYHQLLQSIKKTRKLLTVTNVTDPEYSEYAQELQTLIEKRQNMEESLWQTALTITRLSNEASSERLQHAIELFNKGDNRGANAILDEATIDRDINRNLQNIELGKAGLKNNIAELRLKIDILRSSLSDGWRDDTEKIHKKIISLTEQVYGYYSEEYSDSLLNSGDFYFLLGKYNEALSNYEKALDISLSEGYYPNITVSYNNIGAAYYCLCDYTKALESFEKGLKISSKIFGENDPDVAISYSDIGSIYKSLGDYTKALEFHNKSLIIRLKIFGEDHPDTATSYGYIGCVYNSLGEYTKALEFHEKSLKIRLEIFGEDHPDTATSYSYIGYAYDSLSEHTKALEFHEKSLKIRLKIFGQDHSLVAISYGDIGCVYHSLGHHTKALDFFEKSLKIRLKIFGEEHPDVAASYGDIGCVYHSLGDYTKALEFHEKSLKIQLEIFGEDHLHVAASYNSIGVVYDSLYDYNKALEFYKKSLNIRLKIFGEDYPDVATSYIIIGGVYDSLGNYTKALEYLEKSLNIQLRYIGEDDPDAIDLKEAIESVKEKLGNKEQ